MKLYLLKMHNGDSVIANVAITNVSTFRLENPYKLIDNNNDMEPFDRLFGKNITIHSRFVMYENSDIPDYLVEMYEDRVKNEVKEKVILKEIINHDA